MTTTGFSYLLQGGQKEDRLHRAEDISYIVWEPSRTLVDGYVIEVGRKAAVVGNLLYAFSFPRPRPRLRCIAEDVSKDAKTTHAKESLGAFLFSVME